MPSSYTPLLRLTLPADGELVGTWGQTVNNGITSLEEAAIAGTANVALVDADYVMSVANGAADVARNAVVRFTGALTAQRNITVPSSSKTYIIRNNTTGGFGLQVKTAAGTGVVVPAGSSMLLYCDGANVMQAVDSSGTQKFADGTAALPGIAFAAQPNLGLFRPGADVLGFSTAGTERMRIDAGGDVGISAIPSSLGGNITTLSIRGKANARGGGIRLPTLDGSQEGTIYQADGLLTLGTISAHPIQLISGNVERMRVDTAGNVGIGTTVPSAIAASRLLQIVPPDYTTQDAEAQIFAAGAWFRANSSSNSGGGYGGFQFYQNSVKRFGIVALGAGVDTMLFTIGSAGTERMRIDAAGKVGIGTTTPDCLLQVMAAGVAIPAATRVLRAHIGGASTWGANGREEIGIGYSGIGSEFMGADNWDTVFTAGTSTQFTNGIQPIQLRLTSVGNLVQGGVGSSWWGGRKGIQLVGSNGNGDASFVCSPGTINYMALGSNYYFDPAVSTRYVGGGTATRYEQGNGVHSWSTAPGGTPDAPLTFAESMRIDSTGRLLLGTTTSPGNFKMDIAHDGGGSNGVAIRDTGGVGSPTSLSILTRISDAGTAVAIDAAGTGQVFKIQRNGNVFNLNNAYGSLSDVKLKENITDATPKLDTLSLVRVVNYNLKADADKAKQIGMIAQELELLFPGLVEEVPDVELVDGERVLLGTATKAIKYSVFIPILVKAVQELAARVAQLEH